tara:strand:+ start:743 stop:979 length:237 start_codon:yes stop_codon:yes gene_type:complete
MEKIKALWAKLNVKTAFIGGALIITTAIGTCTFTPSGQAFLQETTEETTEIEETTVLEDVDVEVIDSTEETPEAEETE